MGSRTFLSICLTGFVLAGCTSAAATTPSPSPSPSPSPTAPPTASPTPTPAPTAKPADAAFTVSIVPVEEPLESRVAIPGEKVSFLVTVESADKSPVTISATASGAKVTSIEPAQLAPGVVGEVWLVPDPVTENATASVEIKGARGSETKTETRHVLVWPMADERAKDAKPYFTMWSTWLAANHPELGITAKTTWDPTFVSTFLVVSHYAYYSPEWEMKVSWHNMIPPNDWTEVYLRHRGTESKPSLAFRIDSVKGKTTPHAVTPPDAVMR